MELTNIAKEYAEGIEKVADGCKKLFGEMVFEGDFDPEHLELLQNIFAMIEVSNRLVVEQAKTIQGIKEKLDKLLGRFTWDEES